MEQPGGSCLDFIFAFLASLELPEAYGCGRHIWNMENVGASIIICENYLYLPKFVCLIVSCLITQVKQYVSVKGEKILSED